MRFLIVFCSWLVATMSCANAEQRLALVFGNGAYSSITALDNPVGDASLISDRLQELGFEVTLITDASRSDMTQAIAGFGRKLREAGPDTVGLFYFAGHGVQSFGANYLVPVDAQPANAADLDLVALEASAVLRQMASAQNKTNIVILDACRNNPFEAIPSLNDNGLAEMKAPTGTYLALATAPGGVALDGTGANSPFTAALAEEMMVEGAPIEQVFKQVRVRVIQATNNLQTPWDTSSMTQNFSFRPGQPLTADEIAERQLWDSVRLTQDPVQIMLFLRAYPGGVFEDEARALLGQAMDNELNQNSDKTAEVTQSQPVKSRATPGATESQMLEAARASGRFEDYETYLEAYPDGVFAELAKLEMAALAEKQAASAPEEPEAPSATQIATSEPDGDITFETPLSSLAPEIDGHALADVIHLTPTYPPIEGLPKEFWEGQQCSSCHEWNRERLCTQAKTYLGLSGQSALGKEHPFGGALKFSLRNWAAGGCL